jgi:hypothetical protein
MDPNDSSILCINVLTPSLPPFEVMQAFVGAFTKLRWRPYGSVTTIAEAVRLRTSTTMSHPLEMPSHFQNYYSPDFKRLYKKYLAGRTDNRFLPLAEVRGRPTYGSLPVRSEVQWVDRYVSRSVDPPLHIRYAGFLTEELLPTAQQCLSFNCSGYSN